MFRRAMIPTTMKCPNSLFMRTSSKRTSGMPTRGKPGNATGWVDQRAFEQSLPSLRAGPLVRARCEGAVAGRSPTGTLYRRLCDLLPIPLGRHPRTGRLASAVGKVRPYSRADQDQIGRVWSVRAETRGQTRQEPPGNYLLPGPHPVLHAEPKRKLQGWDAHREISAKAQPYVSARANAANTTSHNK